MKRFAWLAALAGCTDIAGGVQPLNGVYRVSSRRLAVGGSLACDEVGDPTDPAVPDRKLVAAGDHPGKQGWVWCDSQVQCDPPGDDDWFDPDGDRWIQISASVKNGPDNTVDCLLRLDTLALRGEGGGAVHVDLLSRSQNDGDLAHCTVDRAIAVLGQASARCIAVDRYELAPL